MPEREGRRWPLISHRGWRMETNSGQRVRWPCATPSAGSPGRQAFPHYANRDQLFTSRCVHLTRALSFPPSNHLARQNCCLPSLQTQGNALWSFPQLGHVSPACHQMNSCSFCRSPPQGSPPSPPRPHRVLDFMLPWDPALAPLARPEIVIVSVQRLVQYQSFHHCAGRRRQGPATATPYSAVPTLGSQGAIVCLMNGKLRPG